LLIHYIFLPLGGTGACHFLPPHKSIGLAFRGYQITWLDLALVAYPTAFALGMWAWSGNWLWILAVAGSMAFAFVIWGWR